MFLKGEVFKTQIDISLVFKIQDAKIVEIKVPKIS